MIGKKLWIFLIAQTVVFALLLVGIALITVSQGREQEVARDLLVEEIRANSESVDSLRSGLLQLTQDTGEIRDSLNLPRRQYTFLPEEDRGDTGEVEENPFGPYFSAIEALVEQNRENRSYRRVAAFLEEPEIWNYLTERGVIAEAGNDGAYTLSMNDRPLATLLPEGEERFRLQFFGSSENSVVANAEEFRTAIENRIEAERRRREAMDGAVAALAEIRGSREVRELLDEYGLYFGTVQTSEQVAELPVFKGRNEAVFALRREAGAERTAIVGENNPEGPSIETGESPISPLERFLRSADLRTDRERRVDERVAELRELMADEGFQAYLETLDLTIETDPREGEEYLYFDLQRRGGAGVGSLAIQRLNATVWIMDEDDVPLTSLRRLSQGESETRSSSRRELPANIPEVTGLFDPEGEETYLILGSHERMADTIVLAHVNHEAETVQLISVPRDLYYRGRKINVLYPNYGGSRFAEELSQITGLKIAGFVAVDMYAFIDVVNILGGIEVTLDEPLIDPTYKTKDNGRWSTLYYPAGSHQLSGIEALRLARSRHTSSDFGRAERQQAILMSLKNKFSGIGDQGLGTIYELVSSLLRYVESDLSGYRLARLLNEARGYDITGQLVLNTDNILYHTYSNLYYSGKSEEEVAEDFYLGAWILLPKENDWNALRWYIREALGREAA